MFKTLILSGGGMKGICTIGAISELNKTGFIDDVDTFVGISIGSLLASYLVFGVDEKDMLD